MSRAGCWLTIAAIGWAAFFGAIFLVQLGFGVGRIADGVVLVQSDNEGDFR